MGRPVEVCTLIRVAAYLAGMLTCACIGVEARTDWHQPPPPRRVYVLHSGVHVILSRAGPNGAAEHLRGELRQRGISERDIVVLDNPFPAATWADMFPRESAMMFLASANPASATAQQAYRRLDRDLKARDITDRDEILWVGHSAGGQMGMTMAHLAHRLHHYPELARQTHPYRFGMVVTLGTPVAANQVPPDVALRHYYSSADSVVGLLARHSSLLGPGIALGAVCDPGPNVKIRVFQGVRHPGWCWSGAVVDTILAETRPACCRPSIPESSPGLTLSQLLCRAFEQESGISFED